jgi:hypothetical protein
MAFPERGVILRRRNLKISSPPPDLMTCRVSEKPEDFFSPRSDDLPGVGET